MTPARERVAIVVQARMSSTRLPGKVLRPLAGVPAILRMWARVEQIRGARARILATSTDPSDDPLVATCQAHRITVVRGPLQDVLARFVAAVPDDCGTVVRLTGDCPLVDPVLVEQHVERFLASRGSVDCVTNAIQRTMPDGLDVEVVSRSALALAHARATDLADREHVLPWVHRHARVLHVRQAVNLSDLRVTLDTSEDHAVLDEIFASLLPRTPRFGRRDVYHLLVRRPELIRVSGAGVPDAAMRQDVLGRIVEHLAREHAA